MPGRQMERKPQLAGPNVIRLGSGEVEPNTVISRDIGEYCREDAMGYLQEMSPEEAKAIISGEHVPPELMDVPFVDLTKYNKDDNPHELGGLGARVAASLGSWVLRADAKFIRNELGEVILNPNGDVTAIYNATGISKPGELSTERVMVANFDYTAHITGGGRFTRGAEGVDKVHLLQGTTGSNGKGLVLAGGLFVPTEHGRYAQQPEGDQFNREARGHYDNLTDLAVDDHMKKQIIAASAKKRESL